jgi:hypothetical protein
VKEFWIFDFGFWIRRNKESEHFGFSSAGPLLDFGLEKLGGEFPIEKIARGRCLLWMKRFSKIAPRN